MTSGTERAERRLAAVLLAPALAVLASVTLYPLAQALVLSLERRVPVFGIDEFVGLRHYAFLLRDPAFANALRVTVVFTVASVALEVVLGVAAALALATMRRWRAAGIGLLLLPWCLPGVVTARIFEWLYEPTGWLGIPGRALPALIVADVWRTTPFLALFAYARLISIPPAIGEAAAVDGAGWLATFRTITLPLLAPVLLTAALFRTLDALRAFDLMYVLTGGGPAATTETLTLYAYRHLFQTLQLGLGAAAAVLVLVIVALVAWAHVRALEATEART